MSGDPNRTDYVVICCGDTDPSGEYATGGYELATRTVFPTRKAALEYARGIATGREPLVIPGRWGGLRWDAAERFPEMRRPGKMPG